MNNENQLSVAVIVAHPDDETLWAGGTILSHPMWKWFVVCLCRSTDQERSEKFYNALKILNAEGIMGNLDDEPEQQPLAKNEVEQTLLPLLPRQYFDLIITHNPSGEYTKHLRHEEISKAVIELWRARKIFTAELWTFAYEDGNRQYYPIADKNAPLYALLETALWQRKYYIITETFGFDNTSWEAETTPKAEAFWKFTNAPDAENWLKNKGKTI